MPAPQAEPIVDPALTGSVTGGGAVVGASVDLGSNSVHLLVAEVAGHRLQPIVDESVFLGLGSAVAEHGNLDAEARGVLVSTLVDYADRARAFGAANITFIGTEPIRRASDARQIVAETEAASGIPLHVLSHEEEAYLMIIGVTEGMPVTHETLVVDVGGGSSEFCVVDAVRTPRAAGLQLGSARLTDRFVSQDPPIASEVSAMRTAALEAVRGAPEASPSEIVAVGGTASNILKLLLANSQEDVISRDGLAEALAILAFQPAEVAAQQYLIRPTRARILPAGAVILDAILEHYRLPGLRVSEAGIREGTILAVDHAGPAWREVLPQLAHGWRS